MRGVVDGASLAGDGGRIAVVVVWDISGILTK
jgi:hypothetical protein